MDDYWAGGIVVWMQSPLSCGSGKWKGRYGLSAFTSPGEYAGKEVTVMLDGKKPFEAKVVKAKNANRKGTSYAVSTGRRKINVTYNGKVIYSKEIFVSTQETKIITLP